MERQTLSTESESFVADKRAQHRAEADGGADDYLPAKDRRNREHVLGPLCRVREDDDVLWNGIPVRVICAARDQAWFMGLQETPWGLMDAPFDGQYISDRAPADPEEEALPIFLEPEPEP